MSENQRGSRRGIGVLVTVAFLLGAGACTVQKKPSPTRDQATVDYDVLLTLPARPVSYREQVAPILERRCVVCHGCYDAPCQLKLSSYEGLERGAHRAKVYNGARILAAPPTRLFVDAGSTAEWRAKGFTPVLNEGGGGPEQHLQDSLLYRMLRLKQRHPQPRVGMLPDDFTLRLDRKQTCPTVESFDSYARRHPLWGMPYGMPNLSDPEYRTLVQWVAQGAPAPAPPRPSPQAAPQIDRWEAFLNGESRKQQLVSRYLYEHLFLAHLHFAGTPPREFYRLVRSRTPSGEPVSEVATRRPYGDPGSLPFYYRLIRYHPGIVAKDHVVYELSDARMARYRELFLEPEYQVRELPTYRPRIASNPFKVFGPIPPVSRYRFLLDDARFFIEGFIKGPVCRGQVALNVIDDQFWVMFFDPVKDVISVDPDFLERMSDYLQLPTDRESHLRLLSIWTDYWQRQKRYIAAKEDYFKGMHAEDLKHAMSYVWDGDGRNPNAALTVFRHFDSASVRFGLVGDYPESAWIIDYPMFERIHYLLVAGFDVYGNIGHQLNSRLYMDFLRMEGEDNFLSFLPVRVRRTVRDSWYKGVRTRLPEDFKGPMDWLDVESVIGYRTADPQRELYQHLEYRLAGVRGPTDHLNRCPAEPCDAPGAGAVQAHADRAMRRIAEIDGSHLSVFPDVTFLRVRTGAASQDLAYTIILNKGYKNLTSIFEDEERRDRDDDTLTVVKGLEGSYPNFFFVVDQQDLSDFAERYAAIRNRVDYERFVGLYGIRRTNSRFWPTADWFHDRFARDEPLLSGLFDLNRYDNR